MATLNLSSLRVENEDRLIAEALNILKNRIAGSKFRIDGPDDINNFLLLKLGMLKREHFGCLFLDSQNFVLCFETMFMGTTAVCTIHPREVLKRALVLNACAVVLVHNHPSCQLEPSGTDREMTIALEAILNLGDVLLIDHIIVAGSELYSMRQHGDF